MKETRHDVKDLLTIPARRLQSLFPEGVLTVETVPSQAHESALYPEELELIKNAVPKRRREFAAGRACAQAALRALGTRSVPILAGSRNAPIWPGGIVGSISHTSDYCAAVAAPDSLFISLGLDVEKADPLPRNLWTSICSDFELETLGAHDEIKLGQLVKLIFSSKESVYKCQYPLTGVFLDFLDVELLLDLDNSKFNFRFLVDTNINPLFALRLEGNFIIDKDLIFTGMNIPKEGCKK